MPTCAGCCGHQKALVAIPNKRAPMIWAMLARDERHDADRISAVMTMPALGALGTA
jgi:hypothetical protein